MYIKKGFGSKLEAAAHARVLLYLVFSVFSSINSGEKPTLVSTYRLFGHLDALRRVLREDIPLRDALVNAEKACTEKWGNGARFNECIYNEFMRVIVLEGYYQRLIEKAHNELLKYGVPIKVYSDDSLPDH